MKLKNFNCLTFSPNNFAIKSSERGPCTAKIFTFGSWISTSNLFPAARPFAKKITSESAIDSHHLSSANLFIIGSLTKRP